LSTSEWPSAEITIAKAPLPGQSLPTSIAEKRLWQAQLLLNHHCRCCTMFASIALDVGLLGAETNNSRQVPLLTLSVIFERRFCQFPISIESIDGFNQCSNLKTICFLGIVMGDCFVVLSFDGLGRLWVRTSRARLNEAPLRGAIATFQDRSYDPTAYLILQSDSSRHNFSY
jgi:hypothetical protein